MWTPHWGHHCPVISGGCPHLWFLLGSSCGAGRQPVCRGLSHPLRVQSLLETSKSHLRGAGQLPSSRLCCVCRSNAGRGGQEGTGCMQENTSTKQIPALLLPHLLSKPTGHCWRGSGHWTPARPPGQPACISIAVRQTNCCPLISKEELLKAK